MATPRLLLIDDQPLVLSALARFLEQRGYEVHTAANGRDGLDCARRIHPDLVITDIKMPVMDGWTLVKTLRSNAEFTLLPVIILTDDEEAETRMQGFRLGADDFVPKSAIVEEVDVRVGRALERSRAIQEAINRVAEGASVPAAGTQPIPAATPRAEPIPRTPSTARAAAEVLNLPPLAKSMGLTPSFAPLSAETEAGAVEAGPGMQGSLSEIGLASILTLLATSRKSGVLSITGPEEQERGQVILRDGNILRVRVDREPDLKAVDAVSRLMKWRQGKFVFSMQDVTARDDVQMPTEHLLMEASRMMDEGPGFH